MGSVFRLEGGLMGALTKISDICIISLLWLFCCLPVVTIGASTTAAYYTVIKVVRRQSGNLTQSFFHSFRENLKDSLIVNLSYLALTGLLAFNIYTVYQSLETYEMALFLLFLYTACLFLIFMAGLYTYAFLSRFSMERKNLIIISWLAMFRHMPSSLFLLALFLLTCIVIVAFPIGAIFMPGVFIACYSRIMEHILRKYMTAEMLAKWEEDEVDAQ